MSNRIWVRKESIICDRRKSTVHLLEERVYPGDTVPDVGEPFRIRAQKCSAGIECNLHGFGCRWSGLNPMYDPFYDIETASRR